MPGCHPRLEKMSRWIPGCLSGSSGFSQDWKDKVGLSEEYKTVVGNTGHDCSQGTDQGIEDDFTDQDS